jgi:hypothetical protein
MKTFKYLTIFLLDFLILGLPSLVYAQDTDGALPALVTLPNLSRFSNLGELAGTIITVLLIFIAVLAVGALIYGGYQYITSAGNPESAGKAKSTITWGIIGLIVAFAAYIIVDFIASRLTG